MDRRLFKPEEVAQQCSIDVTLIIEWIENEWIVPADADERNLDAEDMARIQLIHNLRTEFGVNDEAVPIILSLLDQLHSVRNELRKRV